MEEKDNKVVEMPTTEASNKITYEQLEQTVQQLRNQVNILYNRIQEMNMTNTFKRLDYLFKVVSFKDSFGSFASKCAAEIELLMTLPEEVTEEENKKDPEKIVHEEA